VTLPFYGLLSVLYAGRPYKWAWPHFFTNTFSPVWRMEKVTPFLSSTPIHITLSQSGGVAGHFLARVAISRETCHVHASVWS